MLKKLKFEKILSKERILITGHTGFTGGWVSVWLHSIGIEVAGFSLDPNTSPSLFEEADLKSKIKTYIADLSEINQIRKAIVDFKPTMILHLAAQPLVRKSYSEPYKTFLTNTLGTANVLEASKDFNEIKAILCVTTDKVYKNKNSRMNFNEDDQLGGNDPYSASKAAAEMIIQGYLSIFLNNQQAPDVAIARGGNIIGGGDWSEDRIIPDFIRSIRQKSVLKLRYPNATRPWQHVLALVHGYLLILSGLASNNPQKYSKAWNFGPITDNSMTVKEIVDMLILHWAPVKYIFEDSNLPEASHLSLNSNRAIKELGWKPLWDNNYSILKTVEWYKSFYSDQTDAYNITLNQINEWRSGF